MRGRLTAATLAATALVVAGCASAGGDSTSASSGTPLTTASTGPGNPTTGDATVFTGRVTSEAGGRALPGIRVNVYQAYLAGNTEDAYPVASTDTRADGSYRVELPASKVVSPSGVGHQVVLCVFSLEVEYNGQCSPGLYWDSGGVIPAASRRYAADRGARYVFDATLGTTTPTSVLPTATVRGRVTARDDGAGVPSVRVVIVDVAKALRQHPLTATIVGFTTGAAGAYSGTVAMTDPYSRTIASRRVAVCFEILGNGTRPYQAVCAGGRPTNAFGHDTIEQATRYTLRPGQTLTVDQEIDD